MSRAEDTCSAVDLKEACKDENTFGSGYHDTSSNVKTVIIGANGTMDTSCTERTKMADRSLHCPNCGSIFDITEDGWDGAVFSNQKLECNVCHHPLALLVLQPEVVEHSSNCNYCNYLIDPVGISYDPKRVYRNEPEKSEL